LRQAYDYWQNQPDCYSQQPLKHETLTNTRSVYVKPRIFQGFQFSNRSEVVHLLKKLRKANRLSATGLQKGVFSQTITKDIPPNKVSEKLIYFSIKLVAIRNLIQDRQLSQKEASERNHASIMDQSLFPMEKHNFIENTKMLDEISSDSFTSLNNLAIVFKRLEH
jgi:hypothetical protein